MRVAFRQIWRCRVGFDDCAVLVARASASAAAQSPGPRKIRRSVFDLPQEANDDTLTRGGERRRGGIQLDTVKSEDVLQHWPPKPAVSPGPVPVPVKRPNIYVNAVDDGGEDQGFDRSIGFEDAGRFVRVARDSLINLLPEGACGELPKDITLVPSRTRPIGIMLRKATIELMSQLSDLRDLDRIPKAGFLLDGHRGVGKSMVLNQIAMWARMNGWLVVMEPVASRYLKEIADIKRSNNGVYIQNEFAQQFLEATSVTNRSMLEEIPVDMESYGSRAIDGEPASETRRLYEPLIEDAVAQEGLQGPERLARIADYKEQVRIPSMAEHLSEPRTVWEIVEFGLQNEAYATQAVSEMFVQLQRQTTHPVLVICDEWNELFPVSQYVSIRYDNTRFHGYIPGYHLTMPRALHRWDGHLYKRGLKLYATSWRNFKRRDYRPDLLGVKDHQIRTIRAFSQHEFANFVAYYRMMNILHQFPAQDLEYYYMLTQGNGFQARRVLTTLY